VVGDITLSANAATAAIATGRPTDENIPLWAIIATSSDRSADLAC
jgi:hypothetical protein